MKLLGFEQKRSRTQTGTPLKKWYKYEIAMQITLGTLKQIRYKCNLLIIIGTKEQNMDVEQEFSLFRSTRSSGGVNTRINRGAVNHIVTFLLPYYPQLKYMKTGERTDFVIYLFEKALKGKMPDYQISWEAEVLPEKMSTQEIF